MDLYQEVFLATCLTMSRHSECPDVPSAIFLSARAGGDWEQTERNQGLINLAAQIYKGWSRYEGSEPYIVLNGEANVDQGGKPISTSYGGPELWEKELLEYGIAADVIIRSEGGQNTGAETISFVKLAHERGWGNAMILANPHQLLRTMMAMVKAMEKIGYRFKVSPTAPTEYSWKTLGYGSQGGNLETWWQQAISEAVKVVDYIERGWVCTFDELREYVLWVEGE